MFGNPVLGREIWKEPDGLSETVSTALCGLLPKLPELRLKCRELFSLCFTHWKAALLFQGGKRIEEAHLCPCVRVSLCRCQGGYKVALPTEQLAQNKQDYNGNSPYKFCGSFFSEGDAILPAVACTGLHIICVSLQSGKMFLLFSVRFKQCTHIISFLLLGELGLL